LQPRGRRIGEWFLNRAFVLNSKPGRKNKWRGEADYLGEVVRGTLTMVDADTMTINGCKGALCQKFELNRL
jgi:hypothetical protein